MQTSLLRADTVANISGFVHNNHSTFNDAGIIICYNYGGALKQQLSLTFVKNLRESQR